CEGTLGWSLWVSERTSVTNPYFSFLPPLCFLVITFMTVFERSACRPIETMVDIYQEYPDEVEYMFKPSCVLLMKCGGFCNDEALECVPTEVHNVSMELLPLFPLSFPLCTFPPSLPPSVPPSPPLSCLFCFSSRKSKRGKGKGQKRKHKRARYKPQNFHCEPCSERRKHLYKQDPLTCKCSCKFTDSRCKSKQLELNERTCRFVS
uniref:Vascular endothelial growth factor A n=1 Tax=Laticauda laticaudata TaxID=8630 RepID=A0A8C5S5J5_LATLA